MIFKQDNSDINVSLSAAHIVLYSGFHFLYIFCQESKKDSWKVISLSESGAGYEKSCQIEEDKGSKERTGRRIIMKKRLFTTLIATVLAAGVLTGCGNQETAQTTGTDDVEIETGDNVEVDLDEEEETEEGTEEGSEEAAVEIKGTITVAASATPHAEILEQAKSFLAEKGWDLEVTVFDDYIQPNLVVESGEFDANYFQHIPYLDSFNEEQGTHLVNVGGIHYEPFGIYPGTESDLANISEGAVIAVPNDPTNEARALLLLQDNGIITLKEGAGLTATINDIESNPNNIEIKELEAAQVARVKDEVAFVVLNGNYALEAGFSVGSDAVAYELSDSEAAKTYVNVVAVKEGNEENEGIKALVEVLKSDDIKSFIADTYDGAVVAFD